MINEFEASFNLARRMREAGIAWEAVAKVTGISPEMLRRRMEPGFKERRNAGIRNARALRRGDPSPGGIVRSERYHIKPEDAARALATVPTDTRPLASRLMGDPLPGRSALDKARAGETQKPSGPFSPIRAERGYYLRGFLG